MGIARPENIRRYFELYWISSGKNQAGDSLARFGYFMSLALTISPRSSSLSHPCNSHSGQ